MKGIAHAGAIQALEEAGFTFASCAGSSVGALVASLVASGYKAAELSKIALGTKWSGFLDGSKRASGQLFSLLWHYGVHKGEALETWLAALLEQRNVRSFRDLRQGSLKVVVSDYTLDMMVVLPDDLWQYDLSYEFPVASAVRASASIPLFFRPYLVRTDLSLHRWVDGGFVSNFPAWVYKRALHPTLGLVLDESDGPRERHPRHLADYAVGLFSMKFGGARDEGAADIPIVRIPVGKVRTTDFDLSEETARWLHKQGKEAVERALPDLSSWLSKRRI